MFSDKFKYLSKMSYVSWLVIALWLSSFVYLCMWWWSRRWCWVIWWIQLIISVMNFRRVIRSMLKNRQNQNECLANGSWGEILWNRLEKQTYVVVFILRIVKISSLHFNYLLIWKLSYTNGTIIFRWNWLKLHFGVLSKNIRPSLFSS